MIRKIYQKPKCRGIYINAKSTILAGSDESEMGEDPTNSDFEAKRAYGRFAWDEDDEY